METIEIQTLIDITNSGARRANQGTSKEVDQYKNWTTLNQCLGIRSNIEYDDAPSYETLDVKGMGFGSDYKGKQTVWTWRFRPDRTGAYNDDFNKIGTLLSDIDQVPVIKNLDETVNIATPVFDISNTTTKNTIIRLVSGNT
jgi:hypothetical protein